MTNEAKLVYIYLSTSPSLNTLGLVSLPVDVIVAEIGISKDVFKRSCRELNGILMRYYGYKGAVYFFIRGHYESLPNSDRVKESARKAAKGTPKPIIDKMIEDGVFPKIEKPSNFTPPTVEEVEQYGLSKGFIIDGREFISFYEETARRMAKKGWYDSRGKQVKDWKHKLRSVWFKEDRKVPKFPDAPEGFEHFYAKDKEGHIVFPSGWRNGKPYGKNLIEDTLLTSQFEDSKRNS